MEWEHRRLRRVQIRPLASHQYLVLRPLPLATFDTLTFFLKKRPPGLSSSIRAHRFIFSILPLVIRRQSIIRYASPAFLVILVYVCMYIS